MQSGSLPMPEKTPKRVQSPLVLFLHLPPPKQALLTRRAGRALFVAQVCGQLPTLREKN